MTRRTLFMNEIQEIFYRHQQGMGQRGIARSLGVSRNTVQRVLKEGIKFGFDEERSLKELEGISFSVKELRRNAKKGKGEAQESLKKEHKKIEAWKEMPHMTINQMVRLFEETGKKVSETSLRRYVNTYFPKEIKTTIHLETEPGQQSQVDYAFVGMLRDEKGDLRKAYAFIMALSYSRYRFVRFVFKQNLESWIDCHIRAFHFFKGVPKTVVLDNLKAGIITPDFYDPIKNKTYAELEHHYGFIIDPTKVRTPEHKGKIERSVIIVRQQILAGRKFKNIEEANEQALHWCREEIAHRVTSTTGETPWARYEKEKDFLIPLPESDYEQVKWQSAKAHKDQHIVYEGSFYSVPHMYVGKTVWLRIGSRLLEVFFEEKRIKAHALSLQKGQWITDKKDYPERSRQFLEKDRDYCLKEAEKIGPSTFEFMETVLEKSSIINQRKAQAILRLRDHYGDQRLEDSCKRAIRFDNFEYKSLKGILVQRLDKTEKTAEEKIRLNREHLKEGIYLRALHEFTAFFEETGR